MEAEEGVQELAVDSGAQQRMPRPSCAHDGCLETVALAIDATLPMANRN